jgi:hypothetical protein
VVPVRARGAGGAPHPVGRSSGVVVTPASGRVAGRPRCRRRREPAPRFSTGFECNRAERGGSAPPATSAAPGRLPWYRGAIGCRPIAGAASPRRMREDRRRHERRAERPRTTADHVLHVEFGARRGSAVWTASTPEARETAGLVHGDIRPSRVLITASGYPCLTGLGVPRPGTASACPQAGPKARSGVDLASAPDQRVRTRGLNRWSSGAAGFWNPTADPLHGASRTARSHRPRSSPARPR